MNLSSSLKPLTVSKLLPSCYFKCNSLNLNWYLGHVSLSVVIGYKISPGKVKEVPMLGAQTLLFNSLFFDKTCWLFGIGKVHNDYKLVFNMTH